MGSFEPNELLTEITVVGIICKEAVFKTINIIILSLSVSLFSFSFCNSFIAFKPSGVAAFPRPNILAIIFIVILSYALLFTVISGNNFFIIGVKTFFNNSIILVWDAISIIPLQRHVIPIKVNIKLTALSVDSKIDLLRFCKFPEKIAQITDIIIKIGHNIFSISPPFLYLYYTNQ